MVKVSIIVVTYNQRDTIGRALDSVLMQLVDFDYEIVVGDDGSTDGTRQVCEAYAERHPEIRLMPAAPNKGVTRNYFDCLEACRGEYIADCAGDDAWSTTDKLAKEVAILDAHPQVAIVHTGWTTRNIDTGEIIGTCIKTDLPPIGDGRLTLQKLLRHENPTALHLCTALYRRSAIMEQYTAHRDFCRAQCSEDFTIEALLCARHQVAYIPDVTLYYSVGSSQSVSNNGDLVRRAEYYRRTIELTDSLGQLTEEPREVYAEALQRLHRYALSLAVKAGSAEAVNLLDDTCRRLSIRPHWKAHLRRRLFTFHIY